MIECGNDTGSLSQSSTNDKILMIILGFLAEVI